MKKTFSCLVVIILFISGCTFNVEVLTPAPEPTPTATQEITQTPFPTVTADPLATIHPASPTPTYPIFSNARTASSSSDQDQQSSFPAGTTAVYAIWEYKNMREGLQIRREWYWNNQLWLMREEAWDFKKYGMNGTIRDISIYDNETGLNSGEYRLRLYIDNVLQPIGPETSSPVNSWITFNIGLQNNGLDDFTAGYGSWDSQWGVEVYGQKRIILKNVVTGTSTEIYTALEVPYVTWFKDSKHFLFVDRDRSEQKPGTTLGIRDHLWIVDVPGGTMRRVYKSDTSFAGTGGPEPSPDGRYIASREGSGWGDACFMDSRIIFFEVASDFNSVTPIRQQDFSGLPVLSEGFIYFVKDGYWQDGNVYSVTLDATCTADKSKLGQYTFNVLGRTAAQSSSTGQSIPGDLGLGSVHGKVVDAATGAPIATATVTCEHHSYASSSLCSGSLGTNTEGAFAFNNVFFHDTDVIKIKVQAAGYETLELSRSSFTLNDWEVDVVLKSVP